MSINIGHEPEADSTDVIAPVILNSALATEGIPGQEIENTIVPATAVHTGETTIDDDTTEGAVSLSPTAAPG